MDVGFESAGFNVLWANDINHAACRTYERNHSGQIECGPLEDFIPSLRRFEGVDLVFGGPPCQGFSVAGKMESSDPRSQLIWRYFDAIEMIRPESFVVENVKALAVLEKFSRIRQRMFQRCEDLGYDFCIVILNSSSFGVPQSRERMFLIASRTKRQVRKAASLFFRHAKKAKTVREILVELGPAGSPLNQRICRAKITLASNPVLRKSAYAGMLFNGQGRPLNPDGFSSTLHASMGGNKTPIIDENHVYHNKPSWVEQYHAHLMAGGEPLPFEGAPPFLRRLTVDEALRLQTFPPDYDFVGGQSAAYTQIGNAVPCRLAEAVGRVVQELLRDDFEALAHATKMSFEAQLELSLP